MPGGGYSEADIAGNSNDDPPGGVSVFSGETVVAKIGDTGYATLEEAITAAGSNETTITLIADATENVTIPENANITLDLGGKTLTNTNTNAGTATISVAKDATATVKNGSVIGGTSYYNIAVGKEDAPGGTLTLENVTATAGNHGSSMIDNWGTLTITSGTYTGGLNVVKSEEGSKLTINGGEFTLNYAVAYSYTGVILNYGEAEIRDGTFKQTATIPAKAYPCDVVTGVEEGYSSITKVYGGTFINNHSAGKAKMFHPLGKATSDNIEVSGGTFSKTITTSYLSKGKVCKKNSSTGMYELVTGAMDVALSETEKTIKVGESFKLETTLTPEDAEVKSVEWSTSDKNIATVTNGNVKGVAVGTVTITAKPNGSGATVATCTVHVTDEVAQIGTKIYPTLDQAIEAAQDNDTIKLLKDVKAVSNTLDISKTITINLNGYTITGKNGTCGHRVFNVSNGGHLSLTGAGVLTTVAKNTTGSTSAFKTDSSVINVAENGFLSVDENVKVTAPASNGISVMGTATLKGQISVNLTKTDCAVVAVSGSGKVNIEEGYYTGPLSGDVSAIDVSGGYFTSDPSIYCMEGKTGVASDLSGYAYMVGDKPSDATDTPAEVDSAVVPATVDEKASTAAKEVAPSITGAEVPSSDLEASVKGEADKNSVTATTKDKDGTSVVDKLNTALTTSTEADNVAIVYQSYVDVTVTDAQKTDDTVTELTVDLTPMYRIVATTKEVANDSTQEIVVKTDDATEGVNAVQIGDAKKLSVPNKQYEVKLAVPSGFSTNGAKVSIKHVKSNGTVEYYTGKVSVESKTGKTYVTFTTNGFSPFTIYAASASVASIRENVYPSLQAAVDAVQNGETINILKDGETATVSGRSVNFTVKPDGKTYTINLGSNCKNNATETDTYDIVYSRPSSGSGSSVTTYNVNVTTATNGTVTADKKTAAKGATVTVTATPSAGYVVESVKVVDKDGEGRQVQLCDARLCRDRDGHL